ncbi:MAG: hypothetical protein ACRYFS_07095 [Janthinobacterium lividum]
MQNGDFETGDFTGWTVSGDLTSVDPRVGVNGSYAASFGAELPDFDILSQSLNVVAGQQYTLTFSAQTPEFGKVEDGHLGQPNSLSVTFGGSTVAAFDVPDSDGFTQYSYTVTGNPTNSLLTFDVSNAPSYTQSTISASRPMHRSPKPLRRSPSACCWRSGWAA